jgi:hypothetical protein
MAGMQFRWPEWGRGPDVGTATYPTALIVASDYVAKDAELAVRSGLAYDPGRAQEVFAQVKKMLT